MIESIAKYSVVLLLVASNIVIQCTDESHQANKQLRQEGANLQDGSAYQEEHIQRTSKERVDDLKNNKATCNTGENCDGDFSSSSSLFKPDLGAGTYLEQDEIKTEEKLEKLSTASAVLADENKKDEKSSVQNINIDKESSFEKVGDRDIPNEEEKEDKTNVITTDTNNENVIPDNPEIISESNINKSASETNSTFYHWLKFLLDPIIEEFKDGIYPKLSDKTNVTLSNVSVESENTTLDIEIANVTLTEPANITEAENVTDTSKKVKFQCTGKNVTDNTNATVKLITTAQLLQMLSFEKNDTENVTDCLLVMFYAPWCHFCAKIAPYYNALAKAFPQLDFVAVDTAQFSNLLARFGTVSVPNILVFHHSRAAVKFNQTERTFENLVTFVTNSTGLEANKTVNVTEADYLGPVPSVPTNEPDYLLLISWIFMIFCSTCMFVKSTKGQQWINRVRILWQEHQHID